MQGDGRTRCLEILGLASGASAQEIKAAYRDLAKVWHPDRFTHEPRLQLKAQEQLKEINDAYQGLLTGRYSAPHARATRDADERREGRPHTTPPPPPRGPAQTGPHAESARPARRRNLDWRWLAPALVFCATFAFLTPRLLSSQHPPDTAPAEPAAESAREAQDETERPTPDVAATKNAQRPNLQEARQPPATARPDDGVRAGSVATAATPHLRALPTVTVSIDPTTSLRARPGCPNQTAMTFPAGDEPAGYCAASHRAGVSDAATADPARSDERKKSRLKSLTDRLASPSKWLSGTDGAARAEKKSTPADAGGRN